MAENDNVPTGYELAGFRTNLLQSQDPGIAALIEARLFQASSEAATPSSRGRGFFIPTMDAYQVWCATFCLAVLASNPWEPVWMSQLEQLQPNAAVRGILPDALVTVVSVQWFGSEALELTYKTPTGKVANELLYRHDEARLEVVEHGRPWSFDGDGALFRLVSEAQRIRLAHLFDPVLAVHTSIVEPLPHQITAVYETMLPRQPLRFLLADDPGAGKTIMAGLLMKELIARGDLQRCLVVCPGQPGRAVAR